LLSTQKSEDRRGQRKKRKVCWQEK